MRKSVTTFDQLPTYEQLPVKEGAPAGSSWGVFEESDLFGCLNLLSPDKVVSAARLIRKGAVFPLNLELELPDPPLFGRRGMNHEHLRSQWSQDDEIAINTQSSTQWDSFRHVHHPTYGPYGGLDDSKHGIHHWARRGIATRGVLADVARFRESEGKALRMEETDPIDASDIAGTLRVQSVALETGDILLVRTGWLSWYRSANEATRSKLPEDLKWPGLRRGTEMLAFLWDSHIAAIATDNPSLEVWPSGALMSAEERSVAATDPDRLHEIFMHFALLPLLGLPIGELWDLDALADDCAADGVYEFFLTSAPLNLLGGVASPPNALAIK
jgi:kynurenine formamidase